MAALGGPQSSSDPSLNSLPAVLSSPLQLSGKRAAVVGRSNIVGMPAALLLQREDATVTVIHSRTPDAQRICSEVRWANQVLLICGGCGQAGVHWRQLTSHAHGLLFPARRPSASVCWLIRCSLLSPTQADIIIAACGKAEMVEGDWVKEGAAVIDVGINAVDGAWLCWLGSNRSLLLARQAVRGSDMLHYNGVGRQFQPDLSPIHPALPAFADPSAKRGYRLVGDVNFAQVGQQAVSRSL